MNNYCANCGKSLEGLPYKCRYCGEYFCVDHQLPENHVCQGLDEWKSGKLKEFKKEVKTSERPSRSKIFGIIKKNIWVEFLIVIGVVVLLIALLRMLA
ncbi:MAG: hypothetical protein COY38_04165 [Candidatus Aenigmarchaeota archaeon CG_4_10_14_0_8_um_filter_37_24]|nr:hypothetical protein [Candidatus Aenigmarchaeota archaeon]OIN85914.1 MAG: hypothetical protein AUJ50_04570 [Candidatus Aenigmarchaeota archaeon CG1_02_38_14]PIV68828.1 MAG: hypothetical protein COS07_02875 [Candidatus Aenigmarchaeota archaeon CG01_land_8_20_14_3_00_37_9]PIW40857.1 MAG: hypothetical protein COW21_04945 [Candidatus Aenigmarchaeota archaeon CG15_BIG_FIL_POST_REV_8_21_14_020_37_27]PIX51121.1 MAG: hypothetical protein COZ52_00490 [Candidatus Aenigmarchaeota archaeon CG_4_8_14_3_u